MGKAFAITEAVTSISVLNMLIWSLNSKPVSVFSNFTVTRESVTVATQFCRLPSEMM